MKSVRVTIVLAVLAFSAGVFFASCNTAYAQKDDIGQSIIHPAHPLYFLKTIRESLEMHFAQTTNIRFLRQLEFATRRLREVNSLIFTNHQDLIEPTLVRYRSHLNHLPDRDISDASYAVKIRDSLIIHLKTLENIYGQITNKRGKMATRSIVYSLVQRIDIPDYAKLPACHFLQQEATSSALNEVEKVVLSERAEKCRQSLILLR